MITSIVSGLRDAHIHTRYIGPKARQGAMATLPFLFEQYGSHDGPLRFMNDKGRYHPQNWEWKMDVLLLIEPEVYDIS